MRVLGKAGLIIVDADGKVWEVTDSGVTLVRDYGKPRSELTLTAADRDWLADLKVTA